MGGIRSLGFVCSIPSWCNLDFYRLKFIAYLYLAVKPLPSLAGATLGTVYENMSANLIVES